MTKSTAAPVSARTIRLAFAAGEFDAPDSALLSLTGKGPNGEGTGKVRGRLHPDAIAAYTESTGNTYVEKAVKDEPTVELPLVKVNARGAKLKRPESFPMSQVRALAGVSGRKGRLSTEAIQRAAEAVAVERGWR